TFARMAHQRPAASWDGRSWLERARNPDASRSPRRAFLLQHWRESDAPALTSATARCGMLEPPDLDQQPRSAPVADPTRARTVTFDNVEQVPQFAAVRTLEFLYVEYATGDRELYDVRSDPEQIMNLAGSGPPAS